MSSDTQRPVVRTSERGAATRGALLEAAKEIFVTSGFAEAGVTEVVARANASVGSLYHHFSGKAELYTALFDEFQDRQIQRTKQATQAARAAGVTEPMPLLIAGARAYLEGCFEERDLAALFLRGDGPPGFEVYMRDRLGQWVKRNAALFEEDEGALAIVITGALAAVVQRVALSEDVTLARKLAEQALDIIAGIRAPSTSDTASGSGEADG
ncbi:TetR/AcrR family transcriptional regulator [Thermopolyspora sp. NPDC052614]|uniref:TetR/AcrR family transcriptional regulator n=1 Tax=Thermopolyspora sp. NPDC052614 TaxID=3155682 RepID=UPI0034124281